MTEQDKARETARLLLAWAEGKTLLQQLFLTGEWIHYLSAELPVISDPSYWRIKPEPRKAWSVGNYITEYEGIVKGWRKSGYTVIEWKEVLP